MDGGIAPDKRITDGNNFKLNCKKNFINDQRSVYQVFTRALHRAGV